jgi:uncharacterized protein (TIGR01319 family)
VAEAVSRTLEEHGKRVYRTSNVLPRLETVEVEPAQELIREIFIGHITRAKGLDKAADFVRGPIVPTPKATLEAATLLADGARGEAGIGSLLVLEVGGATTNVHSVIDQRPVTPQTVLRGLPEPRVKRTVEGDLGIRYNAPTIYNLMGRDAFMERLRRLHASVAEDFDAGAHVDSLSGNVGYVPQGDLEYKADIVLAESAASRAVERHAGIVQQEFSVVGEILVQRGKNLLDAENVIGTGGIFRYGQDPERVLRAALFSSEAPWSLKPRAPRAFVDQEYTLYGIGLLAEHHPVPALRIAKKYLRRTEIES